MLTSVLGRAGVSISLSELSTVMNKMMPSRVKPEGITLF